MNELQDSRTDAETTDPRPILVLRPRPRIPGGDTDVLHLDDDGRERLLLRLGHAAEPGHPGPDLALIVGGSVAAGITRVIVDLDSVIYGGSQLFVHLVKCNLLAARAGGHLILANPQARMVNALTVTALCRCFAISDSLEAAAAALRTGALIRIETPSEASADLSTLSYVLSAESAVDARILDASGQVVRHLVSGVQRADRHEVEWDGRDDDGDVAPEGMYICRVDCVGVSYETPLTMIQHTVGRDLDEATNSSGGSWVHRSVIRSSRRPRRDGPR